MVDVEHTQSFEKAIRKIKDKAFKDSVKKHINKITDNPEIGKPLRYSKKGERTVYVENYRIIYQYSGNKIFFVLLDHRDDVYD